MSYDDDATERERMADLIQVHKALNRLVRHGHVTQAMANHALDMLHIESDAIRS